MDNDARPAEENESPFGGLGTQVAEELPEALLAELDDPAEQPPRRLGPILAAVLTFGLVGGKILSSIPDYAVASPWLGFAVTPAAQLPAPLPPYWRMIFDEISGIMSWLANSSPPHIVAFAIPGFGVAFCASAVAAFAAYLAAGRPDAYRRRVLVLQILCGVAAGCVFALSFPGQLARYAAGPDATAAAFALSALWLFLRSYRREGLPFGLLAAAVFLGLACVEQPYFLSLAFLLAIYQLLFGAEDRRQWERSVMLLLGFGFALAWPLLQWLRAGQPAHELLSMLLREPYPAFSFQPRAFPGVAGGYFFAGSVLLLAAPSLLAFALGKVRRSELLMLLLAALVLGPVMPYFANPPHDGLVPVDVIAPGLVAVALLVAAGCGAVGAVLNGVQKSHLSLPLAALALGALAYLPVNEGLDRMEDSTLGDLHSLGQELVVDVPRDAIVVVGRQDLAAVLWSLQAIDRLRPDLHIVPATWLVSPEGRRAAQYRLGDALRLEPEFPTADSVARWKHELPMDLAAAKDANSEADLLPFALWDLAVAEAPKHSVYFLGVEAPWLLARGTPHSSYLIYPATGTDAAIPEYALAYPAMNDAWMGPIVRAVDACNARAAAIRGDKDWPGVPASTLSEANADPVVRAAFEKVGPLSAAAGGKLSDELKAVTDTLWRNDRFFALRTVYEVIAAQPGAEAEVQYQLAAVYAQLGDWDKTNEALAKWLTAMGDKSGEAFARLTGDGRFALFEAQSQGAMVLPQN